MIFNNQSVEKGKDEEIAANRKTEEVIQSAVAAAVSPLSFVGKTKQVIQPAGLRRENETGDSARGAPSGKRKM